MTPTFLSQALTSPNSTPISPTVNSMSPFGCLKDISNSEFPTCTYDSYPFLIPLTRPSSSISCLTSSSCESGFWASPLMSTSLSHPHAQSIRSSISFKIHPLLFISAAPSLLEAAIFFHLDCGLASHQAFLHGTLAPLQSKVTSDHFTPAFPRTLQ